VRKDNQGAAFRLACNPRSAPVLASPLRSGRNRGCSGAIGKRQPSATKSLPPYPAEPLCKRCHGPTIASVSTSHTISALPVIALRTKDDTQAPQFNTVTIKPLTGQGLIPLDGIDTEQTDAGFARAIVSPFNTLITRDTRFDRADGCTVRPPKAAIRVF